VTSNGVSSLLLYRYSSGPYSYFRSLFSLPVTFISQSQWPHGLRRRSAAARLLRSWVRIPPGAWMSVCCECCVLSGRGLCDELITHPEDSYRLWCVVVCDLETSRMRKQITRDGSQRHSKTNKITFIKNITYPDILEILTMTLLYSKVRGHLRW
jgi:hypothetical protein